MILNAVAYVSAAVLLALSLYALLRWLFGHHADAADKGLSTAVITRLGTLHGLILALIFAQELDNYLDVIDLVAKESGAVADTYYGSKRYARETDDLQSIQRDIADYLHTVINDEWQALSERKRLSDRAWRDYSRVDEALLGLTPSDDYQREIKRQILDDWDEVSQFRRSRESAAAREIPIVFWILAIAGFMVVVFPYYVFAPLRQHVMVLALFAGFNGLVFYFIVEMSQPFSGTGAIRPTAMERLYQEDMQLLLETN